MALKGLKTKKSKRLPARQKYKILKKVREHNRKLRKANKKSQKSKKAKMIEIPNICPFKEEFLKEAAKEKQKEKEQLKNAREAAYLKLDMNTFVKEAETRSAEHIPEETKTQDESDNHEKIKNPSKPFFKEFKKVIELADVILEVVDARDPLGTRCAEVEKLVRESPGNKRLVVVLNKADLVPKDNLLKWVAYFRRYLPTVPFKASTQSQSSKLGRRKFNRNTASGNLQSSVCIGAEILMSMLGNYCRNKNIKVSIKVGVVGIPNVGKSSIINSLKRQKSCHVGCTPGITRVMQEVELDSKIKLIDCPGVVTPSSKETSFVLKNAQRITDIKDPFSLAEDILKRANKQYFCQLYDITEFDSYAEFFAKKAQRMGKLLKNGVPDAVAAARSVLNDWNCGKIKYYTQPPEESVSDDLLLDSTILKTDVKEFDINNFEIEILNKFSMDVDTEENYKKPPAESKIVIEDPNTSSSAKTRKIEKLASCKEEDLNLRLPENQTFNKNIKAMQKKKKKRNARNEKKVSNVADILDNFTLGQTKLESSDFQSDLIDD